MTGNDPGFLVVTSSIACQLKDLSSQVFHYSSQIDWCSSSDTFSIVAFSQETMDTSNRVNVVSFSQTHIRHTDCFLPDIIYAFSTHL